MLRTPATIAVLVALSMPGCSRSVADLEGAPRTDDDGISEPGAAGDDVVRRDAGSNRADAAMGGRGAPSEDEPQMPAGGKVPGNRDAGATDLRGDGALDRGGAKLDASTHEAVERPDASVGADTGAGADEARTCDLPTTFKWKGGGPLAQPKNGSVAMKDFTHVVHDGQHIVYFTTFQSSWGSAMMVFKDWSDAAAVPQTKISFGIAPTLFYVTPKKFWVIAYQWGPHKFSYRTSSNPADVNGWSGEKSLYNTALPAGGTGPIDQTVICDRAKCYLFYAGDNGHIYKSSLPVDSFPGEFPPAEDSGIVGTAQNLFEAVQVYKVDGADKFLMIVEAQGSARYFRAFTAKNLDGPWTLLTNDFAVKKNVVLESDWTNDISHGDLVRLNADETFTIDPCNLQLVFQGRDPRINTEYGKLPYRLGLLTLQR